MNLIASVFCCLFVFAGCAQNIKGFVYDENRLAIAGALVYLDETSVWATTDDVGGFELKTPAKINTMLVISYLGYETMVVADPFSKPTHDIHLKPKATALSEVTIDTKPRFNRSEKLRVFTEQFLGTTIAGKSCTILNEADLKLDYDSSKRRLTVSCDQPIRIYNRHLGYEIEYRVRQCYIDFNNKTLDPDAVTAWSFIGTTFYKDLTTVDQSFAAQRKMSYAGSAMQFFRSLIGNQLNQSGFKILRHNWTCDPAAYFAINRLNDYYEVKVGDKNNTAAPSEVAFTLAYPGKPDSAVTFTTDSFTVDFFGNHDSYNSIQFAGNISKNRIGDLLPLDYLDYK